MKSSVMEVKREILDGNSGQKNQMLNKTGKITEIYICIGIVNMKAIGNARGSSAGVGVSKTVCTL